ncbi:glycoside hydrolase family 16 [Gracilaria domingensis]|nr:glycoside hydrolase family 16 [Gracilaria domingensis]
MTVQRDIPPLPYDPSTTHRDTPLPYYLQHEVPGNMKWAMDWNMSDEFDANPTNSWYSSSKWVRHNPLWVGREPSYFSKNNVYIRDGALWLESREERPSPEYLRENHGRPIGNNRRFSTGFIRTAEKRKYGYFEIACKLMDCPVSCAFWFINHKDTEIDVFEYSTSEKYPDIYDGSIVPFKRKFNMNTLVYSGPNGQNVRSNPLKIDVGRDLSQEKIKVGLLWKPDVLVWYLNDREVRRERNNDFHIPLYLQLDSEVFPYWFGEPGQFGRKKLPNAWTIYYVRSYQMVRR